MAVFGPREKPANSYSGQVGWSVGLPTWLDDPSSKVNRYWRVIEYGSLNSGWPWKGQRVAGLWGPNAGPRGKLWGTGTTEFDRARSDQKLVPYFGKLGQDMLGPARKALWDYMGGGKGPNMEKLNASTYIKVTEKKRKDGSIKRKSRLVHASTPGQYKQARKALFFWFMTKAEDASQLPFVQGTIEQDIPPGDFYRHALASFPMEAEQEAAIRESFNFALHHQGKQTILETLRKEQAPDNASGTASKGPARRRISDADVPRYAGHRGAYVSIAAHLTVQALTFDANGDFVNGTWQMALRNANELVAMRFQETVVAEMRRRAHRPPTKALVEATADPQNRYPRDMG